MNQPVTILYIDDEQINLMLFKMNFKRDFNVITAQDGVEALNILNTINGINIVISDMKMPGMTGIEFIQKARIDFPEICYFILTGYDTTKEIAAALDNKSILKCFRKPFNLVEIKDSITEALKINPPG